MSLRMKIPHSIPQGKVESYTLGTYKVFIESVVIETSKLAHSIGN